MYEKGQKVYVVKNLNVEELLTNELQAYKSELRGKIRAMPPTHVTFFFDQRTETEQEGIYLVKQDDVLELLDEQ